MKIEAPRGKLIKCKDGIVRLYWNKDFKDNWEWTYSDIQKFIDSEVLRYNSSYVPFQTGMLEKSGIQGTVIGSGEVQYNSPYGRYLYYGKVMVGEAPKTLTDKDIQYHGAPMRGPLWFERMKADHKSDIKRGASKFLRGAK